MNPDQIREYFNDVLSTLGLYTLSETDRKQVERDLADFIVRKIDRKRFRRKLTDQTKEKIREKVDISIEGQQPLHFVIPFGGYKHYWNPSHPEPDWAEFFHFVWMAEYVAPILAAYEPGVILEYVSEDLILNRMNNYPPAALETYAKKFEELVAWFNDKTPDNLEIRYFRVGDHYDKEEIIREVESLLPERREAFSKLSPEEQEKELHRSVRSVMWDGDTDLTNLSDEEKQRKISDSRLIELAYYDTEGKDKFLGDYFWRENHICICFSFGLSPDNAFEDLTLSSAEGSIVDFWIGRGILESRHGKLNPRIVSKNQYETLTELEKVEVQLDTPDIKNLWSIEVPLITP